MIPHRSHGCLPGSLHPTATVTRWPVAWARTFRWGAVVLLAVAAATVAPAAAHAAAVAGKPPKGSPVQAQPLHDEQVKAAPAGQTSTPAPPAAQAGSADIAGKPEPSLDIVFDTVSNVREISAELNTPFDFYIVARNAQGGIAGWETRVVVDKRLAVLDRQAEGLNMAGEDSWQVGLGEDCKQGDAVVLAHYKAIVWVKDSTDLVLGLAPIARSSFDPPSPGYLTCLRQGDIRPMAAADTVAVVNPARVHPHGAHERKLPPSLLTPAREHH